MEDVTIGNFARSAYERAILVPRDMYAVEVRKLLEEIATVCAALPESEFDVATLSVLLAEAANRCGCGGNDWATPLVVAMMGRAAEAEPARVMAASGKRTTVERLAIAAGKLRDMA